MVKPGYKQTEIGVLPEDWECVLLLDKSKLLNGLTYTPDNVKNNGLLVLRSSNIQNNQLSLEDTLYVNCIVEDEKKIKDGDIMICVRNGSAALIGKCAQAHRDYDATFGAFMAVLRGNHNDYILQILQQGTIQKEIIKNSGATINQITNGDFKLVKIAFPTSNDEEIAIASSLSNVDKLISSLEKLITKKKAIKQGAMQELLTGKRRLPGFSGKWISGKWEEVLDCFSSGATPYRGNPTFYKGSIKWVSSGELNYNHIMDTLEHISTEAKEKTNLTIHPAGIFLMAITGLEASGTRGSCAILDAPATTNQSCMAIYGTDKMSTEYLFHYYVQHGDELAFQYCQGTKQQSYTAAIVKKLPIYYPEDVAEQNAIASVLTSMDNEVRALKQKLAKYRQVKQGMMQQLLTGKIRLM